MKSNNTNSLSDIIKMMDARIAHIEDLEVDNRKLLII